MTNEELNEAVYQKLSDEFQRYRLELLQCSPEEILEKCGEYTKQEDILLSLEYCSLSDTQCHALLKSRKPMKDISLDVSKDSRYRSIGPVQETIQATANRIIRTDLKQARKLER